MYFLKIYISQVNAPFASSLQLVQVKIMKLHPES